MKMYDFNSNPLLEQRRIPSLASDDRRGFGGFISILVHGETSLFAHELR